MEQTNHAIFEYLKSVKDKDKNKNQENIWTITINENNSDNLGIGSINPYYIETNEIQDKIAEFSKIKRFSRLYIKHYAEKHDMNPELIDVEFINYGKTELVFVLTDETKNRFTLLVKQPKIPYGYILNEANNLKNLQESDKNVVAPIEYFTIGDAELYVTPYINQARCIASQAIWGMYIPEPTYHFKSFTKEQERIVNTCMIAKLISYYDFKTKEGISYCKLGGGDFMLPKDWEKETPTIENTLNNILFIAAREKMKCNLDEYIETIYNEFSKATINLDESELKINIRGRAPMNIEDIDAGVALGLQLLEEKYFKEDYQKLVREKL